MNVCRVNVCRVQKICRSARCFWCSICRMFSNFVCTDQINVCSMFFGSCDVHGVSELLRRQALAVHMLQRRHGQGVASREPVQHAVIRQTHLGDAEQPA